MNQADIFRNNLLNLGLIGKFIPLKGLCYEASSFVTVFARSQRWRNRDILPKFLCPERVNPESDWIAALPSVVRDDDHVHNPNPLCKLCTYKWW